MNRISSWFCKIFLAPLVKTLFIKEVKGLKNLPKRNFILVSNHQSYIDIIIDAYLCVPRRFHFIGQIEGFRPPLKWFIAFVYFISGVIPLDRKSDKSREKVIQEAINVLRKGDILVVYPEGRRSVNGEIQRGRYGVARFLLKTGVPIVPAGIQGASEILPPKGKFKVKRIIKVNVGKPLFFEEEIKKAQELSEESPEYEDILQNITQTMMEEIKSLINSVKESDFSNEQIIHVKENSYCQ